MEENNLTLQKSISGLRVKIEHEITKNILSNLERHNFEMANKYIFLLSEFKKRQTP